MAWSFAERRGRTANPQPRGGVPSWRSEPAAAAKDQYRAHDPITLPCASTPAFRSRPRPGTRLGAPGKREEEPVLRWRGLDSTPSGWGRCVVTIGVFDGVHRGHQEIVGRAVRRARVVGLPAVVLTFDPHPSEVVRPGTHPPLLTPVRRKADILERLDVDVLCVLPFSIEFSRLDPAE